MCGGGRGGALAAIRPAFARCSRTERRWKSWRIAVSVGDGDLDATFLTIPRRWSIASVSQPPSVSTTRGTKDTPFARQGWKCFLILLDFIAVMAAPAVDDDRGSADWLRGEVTAMSKAVCLPLQFGRKTSPGRDWEFATNLASGTGERPACFAASWIASRITSCRCIRSYSVAQMIVWSPKMSESLPQAGHWCGKL